MSAPVHIFGTGGHARDVAEIVRALGRAPVFVTHDPVERDGWTGVDPIVLEAAAVDRSDVDFAIGVGDNRVRARIAARYPRLRFPALIHPHTTLAHGQRAVVEAAVGSVVFAGVRIMAGVTVGAFATINLNVTVSHDCDIGEFAHLAPGATIAGNVRVGSGAWIGAGAVVNQGTDEQKLHIGADTVIGSGTVVLYDCAPDSVYVGNPARKIR